MNSHYEVIFSLKISADDYLYYYKGKAKYILTTSQDGRKIRFPANALQKYITHNGVSGQFRLCFDENNKLICIDKIGD